LKLKLGEHCGSLHFTYVWNKTLTQAVLEVFMTKIQV